MLGDMHGSRIEVTLQRKHLKNIDDFTYLGIKLTSDGQKKKKKSGEQSWPEKVFNKKSNLFASNNINLKLEKC